MVEFSHQVPPLHQPENRRENSMSLIPLPTLDELPLSPDNPPNSFWGAWSKNGFDDQLGSLNYLTDEHVLKSMKKEVITGVRVGLKLVAKSQHERKC